MHKLLSLDNFNDIAQPNNTVIIKIGADWCIPCKAINPLYQQFANKNNNENIIYAEINTSNADDDLLDYINIKSLPTFIFYKNNVILNKIIGCDNILLSKYIDTL